MVHTPAPEPNINSYDGHVIGLPSLPPVNCYDVVRMEPGKGDKPVYSEAFATCRGDDFTADYFGYWNPMSQSSPLDLEQLKTDICDGRRGELCSDAINYAFAPDWYQRSSGYQRVQAAWLLDEFGGWSPQVENHRFDLEHATAIGTRMRLEFAVPVPHGECQLVRKYFKPGDELTGDCGSYGYTVLNRETAEANDPKVLIVSKIQMERERASCFSDTDPKREGDAKRLLLADHDTVIIEPCPEPQTLLSFIHLSDAQIREANAKLVNREVSKRLDQYVQSFEHDYEQDLYSPFFYEAIVETINKEVAAARAVQKQVSNEDSGAVDHYRLAPSFMIHTGDAVDSGLASELRFFLETSNRLTIPWYQVVGNHDVLAFGNLKLGNARNKKSDKICTAVADLLLYAHLRKPVNNDNERYRRSNYSIVEEYALKLAPRIFDELCLVQEVVGDDFVARPEMKNEKPVDAFMRAHCRRDRFDRCKPHWVNTADTKCHGYERRMHGFQSCPAAQSSPNSYYAFAADVVVDARGRRGKEVQLEDGQAPRRVWVVVLDTSSPEGAYGALDERQLRWVEQVLTNEMDTNIIKRGDLVMMFAHHPIWSILDDDTRRRLERAIGRGGNVVAYFAGHTHSPGLRAVPYVKSNDKRVTCDGTKPCGYWEVIAPSMLEFPQQGRQVTLKWLRDSTFGYFDILGFAPRLADGQDDVERAMRGAERDICNQHPDECTDDRPKGAKQEEMYSRLFFRMPKSDSRAEAVCRPPYVRTPQDDKIPPCKTPLCNGDGCKEPDPSPYFDFTATPD